MSSLTCGREFFVDEGGGVFYGPKNFRVRGYPAEQKCNDALKDANLLKRFWEASEALTGVRYLD